MKVEKEIKMYKQARIGGRSSIFSGRRITTADWGLIVILATARPVWTYFLFRRLQREVNARNTEKLAKGINH